MSHRFICLRVIDLGVCSTFLQQHFVHKYLLIIGNKTFMPRIVPVQTAWSIAHHRVDKDRY